MPISIPREYSISFTAAVTPQTIAFGFPARKIFIVSDGAIVIYVAGDGSTATTASPPVNPGETYEVPEPDTKTHNKRESISVRSASSTSAGRLYAFE
jgi:hypothetical protein